MIPSVVYRGRARYDITVARRHRLLHAAVSSAAGAPCEALGVPAGRARGRASTTNFATRALAAAAIDDYLANFYNCRRLHSSLGYVSPIEFELRAANNVA